MIDDWVLKSKTIKVMGKLRAVSVTSWHEISEATFNKSVDESVYSSV